MTQLISHISKTVSHVSKKFNLGNGSTWPGHIALTLRPKIIEELLQKSKTQSILVIGTNGKTTTARILTTILRESKAHVIQNTSGANLLNGIASTLLLHTNPNGIVTADFAVFEVDENNVPLVLDHLTPKIIIALDLFRDQLDRYGELDSIAKKWNKAFKTLPKETTLILNADDPLMAFLAKDVACNVVYFGMTDGEKGTTVLEHAADSVYCPNCGHKLLYKKVFYSHLGIWECPNCGVKRPLPSFEETTYPLSGAYNKYNTQAAVLAAKELGITQAVIQKALSMVTPAFGRQEKLAYKGKQIQIFLSKNPISMNESIKTIIELSSKFSLSSLGEGQGEVSSRQARTIKPSVLFVLNDQIPDGRDVSWIWDIDLEQFLSKFSFVSISGDRCYDMALRIEYAQTENIKHKTENANYIVEPDLKHAIEQALENVKTDETLYILPTYSAMLDVRKILTGRKIL